MVFRKKDLIEFGFRTFNPISFEKRDNIDQLRWTYSFGGGNWLHVVLKDQNGIYDVQTISFSGEFAKVIYNRFLLNKNFYSIIHFIENIENFKEINELKKKYHN
jgi:hypothetical protein